MPSWNEIKSSIYGAWRIALLDPGALRHFNVSIEGFWQSFIAIPIAFAITRPKYLLGGDADQGDEIERLSTDGDFIVTLIFGLIGWIVFVVVMVWITKLLNLTATYVQYIIVWNWGSVVSTAFMLPVSILAHLRDPADGMTYVLTIVFSFVLLYYSFRVARVGLGCAAAVAIGITAFELVLNLLIYKFSVFIA